MTERTRVDWGEKRLVEFGPEEVGKREEEARRKRDDWVRGVLGGVGLREEREDWRMKDKRGVGRNCGREKRMWVGGGGGGRWVSGRRKQKL